MDEITKKLLFDLGISAIEGSFNFIQAKNTADIQRQAEIDAAKYVEDAVRQAKINAQKLRSVSEEPFRLQSEAVSQDLASTLEALGGDYRTALSVGSQLGQAFGQQQAGVYQERLEQIQDLESDIATEEQNVAQRLQDIAEERARGAQQVAAQSEMMATQSRQRGLEAFATGVGDFAEYKYGEKSSGFSFGKGNFELKDPSKPYDPVNNPYVYKP